MAPRKTTKDDPTADRQSVWDDELATRGVDAAMGQLRRQFENLIEERDAARAEGADGSSAVTAERVVELERQVGLAERERDTWRERSNRQTERTAELEQLLATAYVAREVPWSDVAAGMMTIARDGTPWMVESRVAGTVLLRNGTDSFVKSPAMGETVRVLVPYVTPEQAEELVREQLGGRA